MKICQLKNDFNLLNTLFSIHETLGALEDFEKQGPTTPSRSNQNQNSQKTPTQSSTNQNQQNNANTTTTTSTTTNSTTSANSQSNENNLKSENNNNNKNNSGAVGTTKTQQTNTSATQNKSNNNNNNSKKDKMERDSDSEEDEKANLGSEHLANELKRIMEGIVKGDSDKSVEDILKGMNLNNNNNTDVPELSETDLAKMMEQMQNDPDAGECDPSKFVKERRD